MWPWIKRWLDWLMSDAFPLSRTRPHGLAVHTRYEKAGLTLYELPVPWNADAVVVEVLLRLPLATRKKTDFTLRLPGREPLAPESLRLEAGDRHRLTFRLAVPPASLVGELLWKQRLISLVSVPILTADEFVAGLRFALPTVSIRLGARIVAAQTYVASQCKGLMASCVLKSATPLAPIADLGLKAVFRSERSGTVYEVPASLASSQLAAKEAAIAVAPPVVPRRIGAWSVAWEVAGREVARQVVTGIPARRFETSLRISDARFVVSDKAGGVKVTKQPPAPGEPVRLGPCFMVASSEPGMAGLCRLRVHAIGVSGGLPPPPMEEDVLVTDGPSAFAPGMLDAADVARITGFELRHKGRVLGVASLSPVPAATMTAEGGFKPAPEFIWSNAADDELSERLTRLMGDS